MASLLLLLLQMFALAKQPAAERTAAFVPSQPGNFISISNKTGAYGCHYSTSQR
jgi:hypothetical protein